MTSEVIFKILSGAQTYLIHTFPLILIISTCVSEGNVWFPPFSLARKYL